MLSSNFLILIKALTVYAPTGTSVNIQQGITVYRNLEGTEAQAGFCIIFLSLAIFEMEFCHCNVVFMTFI